MDWKQIQEDNFELETNKGWKYYPSIGEIRKNYQESENNEN